MYYLRYGMVFVLLSGLIAGCDRNRVFDDSAAIKDYKWSSGFQPEFEVFIDDTSALYNIYVNVRHTFFYPYQNLWVIVHTTFPDGMQLKKRVDLKLGDKTGKWFGECIGDICDYRVPIQQNAYFNEPGKYVFRLEQNMRDDPIPGIMAIGIRVEKTGLSKRQLLHKDNNDRGNQP